MNSYCTRKTIAMGLLDVALLIANIEKVKQTTKSVINTAKRQQFYYFILTLLVLIVLVQISLAFLLLFVGKMDISNRLRHRRLDVWNNVAITLIVLTVVMQIFATSFAGSTNA
ncbi:PREDICTED: ninjurin-1-like isoform X1 [Priapulus caudatus]|uniref:Ninjurin-1-like isoform X1 n=1 Tax=Priapulus caudatus TaxID=37621 RepID=A0ABM1EXT2_PRICU|nr:PREDICTED: ninjurin-1-like isoform X1 [Priapulus caudatus]